MFSSVWANEMCAQFYRESFSKAAAANVEITLPAKTALSINDFATFTFESMKNRSMQSSMSFYYVIEKLKLASGIKMSDEHINNIEIINNQVTNITQPALQKKLQLDRLVSVLREKVIALKNNKIPFSVKIARGTDTYVRIQLQDIVDRFEHIARETGLLVELARPLVNLGYSIHNSVVELNQPIQAARYYHKSLIEFNDRLSQLALAQPGTDSSESAGTLFSLIAQEVKSASQSISIQEAARGLLSTRISEIDNLHKELIQTVALSLEGFLLESGFSQASAKELLASTSVAPTPVVPRKPLGEKVRSVVKNLGVRGYAGLLAGAVGLGFGGWTGVDNYQDTRLETQITAQNADAGSMVKAIRGIEDPQTRNDQIAKVVHTYQDQLTAEQVRKLTEELKYVSYGNTKEHNAAKILKDYTDHLSTKLNSGPNANALEKRALGLEKMLAFAQQTSEPSTANSIVMNVYQKYKSELTIEEVQNLKTFFRNYNGYAPDEIDKVNVDFANVLLNRNK